MKKITSFLLMSFVIILSVIFLSPLYLFAIPSQFAGNGHYYEVVQTPENGGKLWTDAKSAAEALTYNDGSNTYGGHFVTITDSDEQEFVAGLISQVDYDCWIGGNQDSQDPGSEPTGGWKWVTGESWSYANWDTDEPSDGGDDDIDNQENYALMKTSGYWNDLANVLFFTGGYIVEYDILLQNEESAPSSKKAAVSIDTETNSGFVTLLYNNILDRDPDPTGLANQVAALDAGMSRMDLVYNLIFSEECQNKISGYTNEQFIEFLYQAIFGRDADSGGLTNWLAAMGTGMTKEDVVNAFTHSEEFEFLYL